MGFAGVPVWKYSPPKSCSGFFDGIFEPELIADVRGKGIWALIENFHVNLKKNNLLCLQFQCFLE